MTALVACATVPGGSERELAHADHRVCADRGLVWPDEAYVECRYDLAERRHQRDWQNLQWTRLPRLDQGPERSPEAYRPLSREQFRCERREDDGPGWVACGPQR